MIEGFICKIVGSNNNDKNGKESEDVVEDGEDPVVNESATLGSIFLIPKVPPGASPEMIARLIEQSLSKSSLRRMKKKHGEEADEAGSSSSTVAASAKHYSTLSISRTGAVDKSGRQQSSSGSSSGAAITASLSTRGSSNSPTRQRPLLATSALSSGDMVQEVKSRQKHGHSPSSINSALSDTAASADQQQYSQYESKAVITSISKMGQVVSTVGVADRLPLPPTATASSSQFSSHMILPPSLAAPTTTYFKSSSGLTVRL